MIKRKVSRIIRYSSPIIAWKPPPYSSSDKNDQPVTIVSAYRPQGKPLLRARSAPNLQPRLRPRRRRFGNAKHASWSPHTQQNTPEILFVDSATELDTLSPPHRNLHTSIAIPEA
ncbi:hypothetical protein TNCV_1293891, partial [Trichonephila clavipes]